MGACLSEVSRAAPMERWQATPAMRRPAKKMTSSAGSVASSSFKTVRASTDQPPPTELTSLLSPRDPARQDARYLEQEDMIAIQAMRASRVSHLLFGAAAFQNKQLKASMEDECVLLPSIVGPGGESGAFFGVYDGHGGGFVSKHLARNLHAAVQSRFLADPSASVSSVLCESFTAVDTGLEEMEEADACGSTAVVCVVLPTECYVANSGDSHCIFFDGMRTQRLSADHHVRNTVETDRIKHQQGIILNQRVSGVSRVTRAFGQNNEKDLIIPTPHIACIARPRDRTAAFLLLVSDGVTDVLTDDDMVRYVRRGLLECDLSPDDVCRELLEVCRLKRAVDNMTAVLVLL
ncbi:hypothetical protein SPRG_12746 [Saprolegnia parasitica CBS 223.65]|uniref:PPM-type phosphatase domain-containing protein n=1 Tax=Saprolegnia parasitica (strain CBS 223.65) TaxID=695850 RepID=A0A067C029_SAPPC|nr:hypothetical protein SPRG_12746 [Saprolegnia parasitica CBS 223.65]KDO22465.1 hypothetical protein SPRG_12746 [Saprolegnia parasitica CBS 223.65]|eukprot:XP_012206852.1 hypothetical protein SPRG_12746 [Saprolegnia parasitica CBS 223.65]